MKIAYWSYHRGCGVTSNLAAVALTGVLAFPIKITMMENHYNSNGISQYFFPHCFTKGVAEEENYYLGPGVMEHPACRRSRKVNSVREQYPVIEMLKGALYYMPQINRQLNLLDLDYQQNLLPILNQFKKPEDLVFIDTGHGNCVSSKMILDDADMVVVTLPQDLEAIHFFFQNYSSLVPKAFFIIGNYNKKHTCNLEKITREFQFHREKIGIILHSDEFQLAEAEGRIIEFITSAFYNSTNTEERNFIQSLKMTAYQLMQLAVYNRTVEYCI